MTYYFDLEKSKQCPLRNGCSNNAKEKTYSTTLKSEEHQYHLKQLNRYITPESFIPLIFEAIFSFQFYNFRSFFYFTYCSF